MPKRLVEPLQSLGLHREGLDGALSLENCCSQTHSNAPSEFENNFFL